MTTDYVLECVSVIPTAHNGLDPDYTEAAIITYIAADGTRRRDGSSQIIVRYADAGRVAVVTNAYTTWADSTDSIDGDAEMWVNRPDEWDARR